MEPNGKDPSVSTGTSSLGGPLNYRRLPDDQFFEEYANSVFIQSGAWDLTLVFGRHNPSEGSSAVVQYGSITIPWSQAKALVYFIGNHVAGQEILNGKISIPRGTIPAVTEPNEETVKGLPEGVAQKIYEVVKDQYQKFVEANPEVV